MQDTEDGFPKYPSMAAAVMYFFRKASYAKRNKRRKRLTSEQSITLTSVKRHVIVVFMKLIGPQQGGNLRSCKL